MTDLKLNVPNEYLSRLRAQGKDRWIEGEEATAARIAALLEEARATPGCDQLVAFLSPIPAKIEQSWRAYEASLPLLIDALRTRDAAEVALIAAQRAKAAGAADRKTALALRDDSDFRDAALLAAKNAVPVAAAQVAGVYTPDLTGLQNPKPVEDMVASWAKASASRVFKGHTPDFSDTVEKWLALPDEAMMWLPIFLEREIARSNLIWGDPPYTVEQLKRYKHSGDAPSDEAEMRENAAQYLAQRRARKAAVIAKARATIEDARRTINSEGTTV